MSAASTTLHRTAGPWSWVFLAFLLAALGLQVAALQLPFVRVSVFLAGEQDYRLVHTAQLMWEAKLYLLAALIAGFSVIFPFVKIMGIAAAWIGMRPGRARSGLLAALGELGKWSMIDPLAVCLLIVLASDQWAVAADTKPGVICFLAAVTIAMVLSAIAKHVDRVSAGHGHEPAASDSGRIALRGAWIVVVPVMLLVAAAAFAATIDLPLLQVHQFLLKDNAFGLVDAGRSLFTHRQWALGLLVWGGLIVVPAAVIAAKFAFWAIPWRGASAERAWHVVGMIREWSMLEVFAVALALFLTEGGGFIQTQARTGFQVLVGAIGAQVASTLVAWCAFRAARAAISGTRTAGS